MNSLFVLSLFMVTTVTVSGQVSPDEAAIRQIIHDEIVAWNAGDAAAFARHFASDGTFTNIRG